MGKTTTENLELKLGWTLLHAKNFWQLLSHLKNEEITA